MINFQTVSENSGENFGMSEQNRNPDEKTGPEASDDSAIVESSDGNSSAVAGSEVTNLRQQLEAKEQEAKNNYDRFLRQVAELENFKKRASREKEETIRFANESLVKDLLPVVDNLERAVSHAQGGGNGEPLVEGVEMVLKSLLDVLQKHGVTPVESKGKPFDPTKHEAMAQIATDLQQPNTVLEEHQKGYVFKDRLLRPALVSVATSGKTLN
jgi:molecular chaperone GrpE